MTLIYKELKEKKYYTARSKYKELKKYLDDLKKEFEFVLMPSFLIQFNLFCEERDVGNPLGFQMKKTQNVGGKDEVIISSETKSLFREVIKSLHPDKKKEKNIQNNTDDYINAVKAKSENNLQELIDIAKKNGIGPDIDELTMEKIDILISNFNLINKEIERIHNSYAWIWFRCNSAEDRNKVFLDFLDSFKNEI